MLHLYDWTYDKSIRIKSYDEFSINVSSKTSDNENAIVDIEDEILLISVLLLLNW